MAGQTFLVPSTNISPDNWNKVVVGDEESRDIDAAKSHDQVSESWLVSVQDEIHRTNWHHEIKSQQLDVLHWSDAIQTLAH